MTKRKYKWLCKLEARRRGFLTGAGLNRFAPVQPFDEYVLWWKHGRKYAAQSRQ